MAKSYLLDTNAYYLFFQKERDNQYYRLIDSIRSSDEVLRFHISQVTSMEIHSVLGKYRRGVQVQHQVCSRRVVNGESHFSCSQTWVSDGKKGLKPKVYRGMLKLVNDVESCRGPVQASILAVDNDVFQKGRDFLVRYADKYNFGSHDALIAGTLLAYRTRGMDLDIVTADRGFKAALTGAGISYFDLGAV